MGAGREDRPRARIDARLDAGLQHRDRHRAVDLEHESVGRLTEAVDQFLGDEWEPEPIGHARVGPDTTCGQTGVRCCVHDG